MAQTKRRKQELVEQFQRSEDDTGSPEVQIALLTDRIQDLTDHLEDHPQDHSSRRGLMKMVGRRRSLLDYLRETDGDRYQYVLDELEIKR